MKIIDKIALGLIVFFSLFSLVGIDIFKLNLSGFDENIIQAEKNISYIFNGIALLGILFCLARKYKWVKNVERLGWLLLFFMLPYFIHNIPSIQDTYQEQQLNLISGEDKNE